MNQQHPLTAAPQSFNPQAVGTENINGQALELRDIHLPDPVSWWPPAPGWWLLMAGILLIAVAAIVARKIYHGKQLKRDIKAELDNIKDRFQQTQNKTELARSLSVLLRRASISYYPKADIAGLTGDAWLQYLDESSAGASGNSGFRSDTGRILLTAPYLPEVSPDNNRLDYDAQELIRLCESWLQSSHARPLSRSKPWPSQEPLRGHAS